MSVHALMDFAATLGERAMEARVDVCLVGGLAVHLHADGQRRRDEALLAHPIDLLPIADPRHLSALPRPTVDIDLIVLRRDVQAFVQILRDQGLARDARVEAPPLRYRDGGRSVDLIAVGPADPSDADLAFADLEHAAASLEGGLGTARDPRTHLRLATPTDLFALKSVARQNRWGEKDLADIARLALLDLAEGTLRADLASRFEQWPPNVQRCVFAVRDAFRGRDSAGANAFIGVLRAVVPAAAYDDDLEDDVREQVAHSVRILTELLID